MKRPNAIEEVTEQDKILKAVQRTFELAGQEPSWIERREIVSDLVETIVVENEDAVRRVGGIDGYRSVGTEVFSKNEIKVYGIAWTLCPDGEQPFRLLLGRQGKDVTYDLSIVLEDYERSLSKMETDLYLLSTGELRRELQWVFRIKG